MLSLKDNPADPDPSRSIPHGYIFSAFLTAVLVGSSAFGVISKRVASLESVLLGVIGVSACSFLSIVALRPVRSRQKFSVGQ